MSVPPGVGVCFYPCVERAGAGSTRNFTWRGATHRPHLRVRTVTGAPPLAIGSAHDTNGGAGCCGGSRTCRPATIGFEAVGEVEDDDWEQAVEPVLRREIATGAKLRLLYLLGPEARDVEADAMKADTGFRARHADSFERVAVVSDESWVKPAVRRRSRSSCRARPGRSPVHDLAGGQAWLADPEDEARDRQAARGPGRPAARRGLDPGGGPDRRAAVPARPVRARVRRRSRSRRAGTGSFAAALPASLGLGAAVVLAVIAVLLLVAADPLLARGDRAARCCWRSAAARAAFRMHVDLPAAPRARSAPVLFYNPRSGGGKAERFNAAGRGARARASSRSSSPRGPTSRRSSATRSRGRRRARDGGRRRLAGRRRGDRRGARPRRTRASRREPATTSRSTSASTATTWSARSTPSSTAASDVVDLADVNGRIFVNNVSLGLYAEAVQQAGLPRVRSCARCSTWSPTSSGPRAEGLDLRWAGPGECEHSDGAAILVSNNRYRLGRAVGSRARARASTTACSASPSSARRAATGGGRDPQRPWREWTVPTSFEVGSERPVAAGIDGEAT